jgi:hypothetical protein
MFPVSLSLLLFSVDLILGNKNKSDGDKSGAYGGLILESTCFDKTCIIDTAV